MLEDSVFFFSHNIMSWVRSDFIFLVLIVFLFCHLIYNRFVLGKDSELNASLLLESAKLILCISALAYAVDSYLLAFGGIFFYSSFFTLGALPFTFVKTIVLVFSFFILLLGESFFLREGRGMVAEFPLFLLIAIFAIFGAVQAGDLMTMVLFMEMLSYCLFVMPIVYKITNLSLEAMLKYFILGSFSSAFLLMGTSLVFATFGTVSYSQLSALLLLDVDQLGIDLLGLTANSVVYGVYFNVGFVFIFSALFFKLGLFPFHFWIRDVYEGSSLPIVAFFATVVKIPVVIILVKLVLLLMHAFWGYSSFFWLFLEIVGILSVVYGTFFAYYQSRVKSLLAISGIINMGYVVLALSLHSLLGIFVAINYLLTYCFTTLGLFFVLVSFSTQRGSMVRLTDAAIILRTHGLLGWVFAVTLLSAAGMPPFPGFFPKFLVLWAFCVQGDFVVAFFLLTASVANFVLYIRLIRFMYFFNLNQEILGERGNFKVLSKSFVVILVLCFLGSVFFALFMPLLFWKYLAVILA